MASCRLLIYSLIHKHGMKFVSILKVTGGHKIRACRSYYFVHWLFVVTSCISCRTLFEQLYRKAILLHETHSTQQMNTTRFIWNKNNNKFFFFSSLLFLQVSTRISLNLQLFQSQCAVNICIKFRFNSNRTASWHVSILRKWHNRNRTRLNEHSTRWNQIIFWRFTKVDAVIWIIIWSTMSTHRKTMGLL